MIRGLLMSVPLRLRLAVGHAVLLMAITLLQGLFVAAMLEANLMREADETLAVRATQVARTVADMSESRLDGVAASAALWELAPLEEFSAPGIYVEVLDSHGVLLTHSPNLPGGHLPGESLVSPAALAGEESYATIPVGSEQVRVLARPVMDGSRQIGAVLVGESLHPQNVALRQVRSLLALSILAVALISFAGSWLLSGSALNTLGELTRVARRITATGDFKQRITQPLAQDEVGELTTTFNEMLRSLEDTFRRHREFLADASHELRGPLMVVRGNLDLLAHDLSAGDRKASTREARQEADRMGRLLADLLFLAKNDAQLMIERSPVELSRIVLQLMDRAVALDCERHILVLSRNEALTVNGDRQRLEQMIWNLIHNAIRYTPAGGAITVSLSKRENAALLEVSDTGVGIASEHLPRVFERFFRVHQSRSRADGGTGLGLAIVKQVAESHGGQVLVTSRRGHGSVFTVRLPLATA